MKILVLNCGSSSLKFELIETSEEQIEKGTERPMASGSVERIGSSDARITYQLGGGEKQRAVASVLQHKDAIQIAFDHLTAAGGALSQPADVEAVGHRVVHGGELFRESVLIDDHVLRQIESVSELAPLHNPHNLKGYYASRALLPDAAQVAVFDTAFHQTLPPRAYLYGLPYVYYTRDRLRRYGFHGTSHRYVSWRYASLKGTTRDTLRLITCHLGNGCSICAIDHGRSVDTSMGFTPMDGLLMGTRPGDLDPGAVLYLVHRDPMGATGVDVLLNQQSGLAGLAGKSDMRDLLEARAGGDERARDAVELFCYRAKKYIAAYMAAMGGADAIVFAGGIGENAAEIRAEICAGLEFVGARIDPRANTEAKGVEARISKDGGSPEIWVVPTNEELLIARDTLRCVNKMKHE